jgi:hypothetical protein
VQCVFHARFLLLHFGFGRGANINDRHTAGELRQAFLELLAVVIRGGFLNRTANLVYTA